MQLSQWTLFQRSDVVKGYALCLGEGAKEGTYKAIVWTTYEGRVYGRMLVVELAFSPNE